MPLKNVQRPENSHPLSLPPPASAPLRVTALNHTRSSLSVVLSSRCSGNEYQEQGIHRVVISLPLFLQLLALSGWGTSWTKARGCNQTTMFSSPGWSFPPLPCLINFWAHLYSWQPKHAVATGSTIHLSIEWQRYFLCVFEKIFFVITFDVLSFPCHQNIITHSIWLMFLQISVISQSSLVWVEVSQSV